MRLQWTLASLSLTIAALLYLGLPLEALSGFPLDPSSSYLSELAASDQPTSLLFRSTDLVAGGFVVLGCLLLRGRGGRSDRRRTATLLTLAVFGLGTIADVVFPMACAPSASARCAAADVAGRLGTVHMLHTASSMVALTAAATAAVLLLISVIRTPPGGTPAGDTSSARPRLVVLWVVVGVVIASSVVVTLLSVSSSATGVLPPGGGIAQRLQTAGISAMLVGTPFWLRVHDAGSTHRVALGL